ncbi:ImmA/IrrE family metallo-endopeptidase [Clostridium tepidum]|nr:ImmA/IrrE family metallo-endopeptidase [Clostridium tepidum]
MLYESNKRKEVIGNMSSSLENIAVTRAMKSRNELGIGSMDAVDILKILKDRENISIIMTPLDGEISGLFMRKNDIGIIIINSNRSYGHQLFTAAHEYYHLKYDKGMNSKLCPINKYDEGYENEIEANIFASYFLMPDDTLRIYINERTDNGNRRLNIRDLIYLENYFMVSHSLMLYRLKSMGYITRGEEEEFKYSIISKATKLGYDAKLYKNTADRGLVIHSNYAELAEELLEAKLITAGKYEELLLRGGYEEILFGDIDEGEKEEHYAI